MLFLTIGCLQSHFPSHTVHALLSHYTRIAPKAKGMGSRSKESAQPDHQPDLDDDGGEAVRVRPSHDNDLDDNKNAEDEVAMEADESEISDADDEDELSVPKVNKASLDADVMALDSDSSDVSDADDEMDRFSKRYNRM